jgi:hypothetical protein
MTDPLFWLVLSLLFVTASLTIALVVAIPALKELARAARSADKLFETLRREFPPALQAIRTMGLEVSDLTEDVSTGVQSAGNVVKQVDQSLTTVRKQAQKVNSGTRSLMVGMKAAWRSFTKPPKTMPARRPPDRLPPPRPDIPMNGAMNNGASPRLEPVLESRPTSRPVSPEKTAERPTDHYPDRHLEADGPVLRHPMVEGDRMLSTNDEGPPLPQDSAYRADDAPWLRGRG